MLPWLIIYNHTNCQMGACLPCWHGKRWQDSPRGSCPVCCRELCSEEDQRHVNQVSADQATEWMNKMCKLHKTITGITKNDQARDKFCITWSERSHTSQDTRCLLNLEDVEEEPVWHGLTAILPVQSERLIDEVKKLVAQLKDLMCSEDLMLGDGRWRWWPEISSISLVSLATTDTAPSDMVNDLLTSRRTKKGAFVRTYVKQWLIQKTAGFHNALKEGKSKNVCWSVQSNCFYQTEYRETTKADW